MIKDNLQDYFIDGYLPSIGIECHVQLNTQTKLFTAINNQVEVDGQANMSVGPLCLGLPGTLPVVNEEAINKAIIAGLVLEANISKLTSFDRKHYFYPDLPLGYQISQHYRPIISEGLLSIPISSQESLKVRIERAHLEADAGKLTHQTDHSLVDLNRVGSPLLEIVSYPDLHSPAEAKLYTKELYLRVTYAQICQGDLSAGQCRFDVNVSVSNQTNILGIRTEIKNLNSFRFVEQAVSYEIGRQIDLLKKGQTVIQETRGWDEHKKQTVSQRSKEDAQDYRYMPDPDIPPITIDQSHIDKLQQSLQITPMQIRQQLQKWQVPFQAWETILDYQQFGLLLMDYAQDLNSDQAKIIINWLIGEIAGLLNKEAITFDQVIKNFKNLKPLAQLSLDESISSTVAKQWLVQIITNQTDLQTLTGDGQQMQISDEASLRQLIEAVFNQYPKIVEEATHNPKVVGFLIGQIMKQQPRANPKIVSDLIKKMLPN